MSSPPTRTPPPPFSAAAGAAAAAAVSALATLAALARLLMDRRAPRRSGRLLRRVMVTASPTTYTLNRHPPWLTYSCMMHGGRSPGTSPRTTHASPSRSWMMATLCESELPSARSDLASSGSCSPAASTCAITSSSVPAAATICRGARTATTFSLPTRTTALSMVSRLATWRTALGRSTTYASGKSSAYRWMRSSHVDLCGEAAGTFWSTTSNGWPA
mmetsp:Transcript_30122/g.75491  ORF Transcript_30122/g.75491 Transcript_30122/m.75491 type:complete len:217 (-) Transcript_30122:403-1053(-)